MNHQRCACRPGCLTWLDERDRTVSTPDGEALAAHVAVQPYPEALAPQYRVGVSGVAS